MNSGKRVVAVIKASEPYSTVNTIFSLLKAEGEFSNSPKVVFIKPNIVVASPYEQASAEFTNPALVAAAVRYFYAMGAIRVIVGDRPAWGGLCRDAYNVSGYATAVAAAGGEMCDLDKEPDVEVPVNGHVMKNIHLPKSLVEADFFVNMPKAKTHFLTGVTVGIKNLFGCLRYKDRKKFHRELDLANLLGDLVKAAAPDLTIVDAVTAMEGFGPHGGTPIDLGLVFGGVDPVAVDTIGTSLMGMDPRSLAVLQVAEELGLGSINLDDILVIGEDLEAVRKQFLPPIFQFVSRHKNVHVHPGGVCPGCRPRIPTVPLDPDPEKKYIVIIGREPIAIRPDADADEFWLVGNCAVKAGMDYLIRRAFSGGFTRGIPKIVKVPGCPPLDWYSQQVIFPPLRKKGWMSN